MKFLGFRSAVVVAVVIIAIAIALSFSSISQNAQVKSRKAAAMGTAKACWWVSTIY